MQAEERSEISSPEDDERGQKKQANRACDFCHRMKMKCIGKETPPCNRCRQSGHECTFDGPRKSKSSKMEDRLKMMEDQMGSLQSTISELVRLQTAAQSRAPPPPIDLDALFNPNPSVDPQQLYQQVQPPAQPQVHQPVPQPSSSSSSWQPVVTENSTAPGSEDEDDHDQVVPTAPFDNMLSLAEAARLKADGHLSDKGLSPRKHFDYGSPEVSIKKRKLSRLRDMELDMPMVMERGDRPHAYADAVDLGYCSEEQGKQLVELFFNEASIYIPCFNPGVDTWESLRARSPMAITTLIMVGAKIQDAGGPESELQRKCKEHAEQIAMSTLFSPVARMELVQALIVLASWGDGGGWRPGGHALRMAMDMGLYRCLPYLVKTNMGQGKSKEELKAEHPLVVGARVWMTLYKMEFELAFNLGRPALLFGEDHIPYARQFLNHPLAIKSDSRLVSHCELLSYRIPLHQPFSIAPNIVDVVPDFDEKLRKVNEQAERWYEYWENYHSSRGVPPGDLLREGLVTFKAGTILYSNARILHGIRRRRDVADLSDERKHFLVKAIRSAETIIERCLRGQMYRKNFRSANIFTHVSAAFCARFLIRMTSLCPELVDARRIGRDVEQLAGMLTQVPGFQFASLLQEVLRKARRNKVLPPLSKPPSPARHSVPLPETKTWHQTPTFNQNLLQPAPLPLQQTPFSFDADNSVPPLDFLYAEQLFNSGRSAVATPQLGYSLDQPVEQNAFANQNFNLDMWFPFPPLENDGQSNISAGSVQQSPGTGGMFNPSPGPVRPGWW